MRAVYARMTAAVLEHPRRHSNSAPISQDGKNPHATFAAISVHDKY